MPHQQRVVELVAQLLDSDATPEEVCRTCPELLPQVRERLRKLRALEDEMGALFPGATVLDASRVSQPPAELPRVPGYEVRSVLGRGGVGVVYRAWHGKLQREVALKMLLAGPFARVEERERFLREVEAVAGLRHPNVVPLFDAGEVDGRPYFTMELVEGGSLAQQIAGVPQPAARAATLVAAIADAVQAAHDAGIVHRDLKPANILLTADGTPRVTDFGLARRLESGAGLTLSGAPVGTPSYMAPEQARGQKGAAGPAADVYGLGAILYELLTGRPPFQAETATATLQQVVAEDPAPPRQLNRRIPRDLETVCLKCLRKEPGRRYASAAAVAADLRRQQAGEPIHARPPGPAERGLRWLRRHPAQARALAVGLALLAVVFVLLFRWYELRQAAVQAAMVQAERDLNEAQHLQKLHDFRGAAGALQHARDQLGEDGPAALHRRLAVATSNLELVERLDAIRIERTLVVRWDSDKKLFSNVVIQDSDDGTGSRNGTSPGPKYAAAFREAGLGTEDEEPEVVAAWVKDSPIHDDLLAALDDWSTCAGDVAQRDWVLEVTRRADPDPWRDQVRNAGNWDKPKVLEELADKAVVAEQSAQLLVVLAARLRQKGVDTRSFIARVALAHPADFWVNLEAADTLQHTDRWEAIGYLRAAAVIRPKVGWVRAALGTLYFHERRWQQAFAHLDAAVRLNPAEPVLHTVLGESLHVVGREDEAIAEYGKALNLAPRDFSAHFLRCKSLQAQGRLAEALDDCKSALQAASQLPDGKNKSLDLVELKDRLRVLCFRLNRGPEFLSWWQKQLATRPTEHDPWFGYAELCLYLGDVEEYERQRAELLKTFGATRDPRLAERVSRACLLLPWGDKQQHRAAALAEIAAAAPVSKYGWHHAYFLFARGLAEYRLRRFQSAIQVMEGPAGLVMGPSPRLVTAMAQHCNGHQEKARKTLAAAVLSYDWRAEKADNHDAWITHILRREAESLILPRLPDFLAGKYAPEDNDERLALLGICQFKDRRLALARLYAAMFEADPKLADDLPAGHRYAAACAAAVAGCGGGADGARLSDKDRADWRRRALKWLRQDLDAWAGKLKTAGPQERDAARKTLSDWRSTPDLAGVRHEKALDRLPPAERQEWLTLWQEVNALLK